MNVRELVTSKMQNKFERDTQILLKLFRAQPSQKPHILFNSNGLAYRYLVQFSRYYAFWGRELPHGGHF